MKAFVIILLTILLVSTHVQCDLAVRVKSPPKSAKVSSATQIIVEYKNTGPEPILINPWFLPSGRLEAPMFEVTRNGENIPYIGRLVKRRPATIDEAISIPPGENISSAIDIALDYDVRENGSYEVQFVAPSNSVLHGASSGKAAAAKQRSIDLLVDDTPATFEYRNQRDSL